MMFWRRNTTSAPATDTPARPLTSKHGKRARAFDDAMLADVPDYVELGTCIMCNWTGSVLALKAGTCVDVIGCQDRQGVERPPTSVELLRQRGREIDEWERSAGLRDTNGRWLGHVPRL